MGNNYFDPYDALLLDNQACFPFYVCAKEIINKYTPFLKEIDLTYTQYIAMMVMWEEKTVLSRHLKDRLFLDTGTLTPVIKKLEEKGLVTKKRSETDLRDLVVTITDKGEALKEQAVQIPFKVGSCFEGMDMKDMVMLKPALERLMEYFKRNNYEEKNNGRAV